MSTLSSTSTLAVVQAAYQDNASYVEDNSVTKAKAFITACIFLIQMVPSSSTSGAESGSEAIAFDLTLIRAERKAAEAFVSKNDTAGNTGNVRFVTLSHSRT